MAKPDHSKHTPSQLNKSASKTLVADSATQGIRESIILILLAVAAFLVLALLSWQSTDPGYFQTNNNANDEILNFGGSTGAWVAQFLLHFFGWLAYAMPLAIVAVSFYLWPILHRRKTFDPIFFGWRFVGLILAITSICALVAVHADPDSQLPDGRAGGIIGNHLASVIADPLGKAGSSLILIVAVMIALSLSTGMSWLQLMSAVGNATIFLMSQFTQLMNWIVQGFINRWLRFWHKRIANKQARAERASSAQHARIKQLQAKQETIQEATQTTIQKTKDNSTESELLGSRSAAIKAATAKPIANEQSKAEQAKPIEQPTTKPTIKLTKVGQNVGEQTATKQSARHKERPEQNKQKQGKQEKNSKKQIQPTPPSASLLVDMKDHEQLEHDPETLEGVAGLLEQRLASFGVEATVVNALSGPVVTRFELQPAVGVKAAKITALATDLARSLAVSSVRVVEVIPGKTVVGIEVPNEKREMVRLSEIIVSEEYKTMNSSVAIALGKDISGKPVCTDLARMPHLLIAGTTGSGKSVGVNAMLLSILFKASPKQVRLILVDPKMLELIVYNDIPHLLTPVITDMNKAENALNWCIHEMDRRYWLMAELGVRNLDGFNAKIEAAEQPIKDLSATEYSAKPEEAPYLQKLPFIVVVIDEFADMIMVVGKKVETLISRLAQKARAAGIHLVLATQRPSVNVITGLIKANIPGRISFQVASKIDSRTILDQGGADQLLGHGDMLFKPPGVLDAERIHGAFVEDDEVHQITEYWRQQAPADYLPQVLTGTIKPKAVEQNEGPASEQDELYEHAVTYVKESERASISSVQRKFRVGYNRAARLIDAMEQAGIVSPMDSAGNREVL